MMRRLVRSLLWLCSLLFVYQLVVALPAALQAPRSEGGAAALGFAAAVRQERNEARQGQRADEGRYTVIWSRRLEPLVRGAAPPGPTQEPLRLTVEGVVLEPGNDFAFVRTADGAVRAVRVGEQVGEGTVTHIDRTGITVSVRGQEVELPLKEAEEW